MDLDFEQRIVLNPAFGAATLWNFVSSHCTVSELTRGPDLPLVYLVLPLAYNQRTAETLQRTSLSGGLLRALDRVPGLAVGLTERIADLSETTEVSLNLACAATLLRIEPTESWPCFVPGRKGLPSELRPTQANLSAIHATARRLGQWIARERREALWAYLDLRF